MAVGGGALVAGTVGGNAAGEAVGLGGVASAPPPWSAVGTATVSTVSSAFVGVWVKVDGAVRVDARVGVWSCRGVRVWVAPCVTAGALKEGLGAGVIGAELGGVVGVAVRPNVQATAAQADKAPHTNRMPATKRMGQNRRRGLVGT